MEMMRGKRVIWVPGGVGLLGLASCFVIMLQLKYLDSSGIPLAFILLQNENLILDLLLLPVRKMGVLFTIQEPALCNKI